MSFSPEVDSGLNVLRDMEAQGGSPRDLQDSQVKQLRAAFMDQDVGHYLMATEIFGYRDLIPSIHLPISRFLGRWGRSVTEKAGVIWVPPTEEHGDVLDSDRRLMVCIPREHFKTSLCTRVGATWQLCKNPNATVAIFNEKEENAAAWINSICEVIDNSMLFQMLWKDMIPQGVGFWDKDKRINKPRSLKWTGAGMRVERSELGIPELSIEPHGIGGAVTGKHFTHSIKDDIIGEKASDSIAIMADAIHWADHARPTERPAENGCELVVFTPWGYADVYVHMMKKWPDEYKVHRRSLLEDEDGRPSVANGKSIFPQKISTAKAKKMAKTDFFVFSSQYQCVPRAGKKMDFSDEWFKFGKITYAGSEPVFAIDPEHYDPDIYDIDVEDAQSPPMMIPLQWMEKAILWDPIPGKKQELLAEPNCRHGLVAVGKGPWGRRFCLESQRLDLVELEACEAVLTMARKWGAAFIGIEEVNFSYLYQPLLEIVAHQKFDGWCPQIIGTMTGGRQKRQRIREELAPVMQRGFWYFNRHGTAEVIEEITEFPHSTFIDASDAMSYTDQVVHRPRTPNESMQELWSSVHEENARGVTGYGY